MYSLSQSVLLSQATPAVFCLCLLACTPTGPDTSPGTAQTSQADTTFNNDPFRRSAIRLNQLGDKATEQGDYQSAIAFFQQSMDSAAAGADSFAYFDSKLDLATVHERLSELPVSIKLGQEVLEAFIRSGDSTRIGRTFSTLASFYLSAEMPREGQIAAQKGFDILKNHGSLIERCAAYNQMAFTYSAANQWAQALPLLDSALLLMRASGVLDQITSMYLNLGNCHRKLGHMDEARRYLHDCADLADSLHQSHVHAVALLRLSQVEEVSGNFPGALQYLKMSEVLKDSIFSREKAQSLQELEVHYQTREKEQAIQLLEANNMAEVARRNMILALSVVTMAAAGFWLLRGREKLRRSRRELEQNQQHLEAYTQLLVLKNTRLALLEEQLNTQEKKTAGQAGASGAKTVEGPDDEIPLEASTIDGFYNRNILTEADWAAFKDYFERSHPGYILRLRTSFPDLTDAEERLFLLLKMNLSSKEAAAMQGISIESIKKNRYRLRKRLALEHDHGLEAFVRKF